MYSKTVTEYLDRTVEKYPDKIAIQDSKRSLSFREVQNEAMHVASFLSSKNLFKKPIAIFWRKARSVSPLSSVLPIVETFIPL